MGLQAGGQGFESPTLHKFPQTCSFCLSVVFEDENEVRTRVHGRRRGRRNPLVAANSRKLCCRPNKTGGQLAVTHRCGLFAGIFVLRGNSLWRPSRPHPARPRKAARETASGIHFPRFSPDRRAPGSGGPASDAASASTPRTGNSISRRRRSKGALHRRHRRRPLHGRQRQRTDPHPARTRSAHTIFDDLNRYEVTTHSRPEHGHHRREPRNWRATRSPTTSSPKTGAASS
jgi:hypothetical protein